MISIGNLPDSSFIAIPLAELHYDLFVSPEYLNTIGENVTEEEVLTKYNIAIQELANNTHCWPHDELPLKRLPRFVVESPDLLTDYVKEGMAIGCLPLPLAMPEVKAGRLRLMFEGKYRFPMTVYAVYHSRRYVPAKVKLLIEELKGKMQVAINQYS
ncbi:transcriptional regulatory protein [Vibrio variabilis]|uniref:Transcriptional regulatory protein n=1 Tax=Vibrio variabilis TaxID=990271 RepID=A0ABQ0JQ13_9VIBR|nr:transcriptional regulatory protein [Vibrio variabilis]